MKNLLLLLSLSLTLNCLAQEKPITSTERHIFWQPNVKLTRLDYQGKISPEVEKIMTDYNLTALASVGIWSVLDIPKKKKDRYTNYEIAYFVPAFDKATSSLKTIDTIQIEIQNLYFDICELSARFARKELKELQDTSKSVGAISIMYTTIKDQMHQKRISMYKQYFKEVIEDRIDGAFLKWRKQINEALEQSKEWATTPKECYRFVLQKPVEDGYIMAPTLIEPLK